MLKPLIANYSPNPAGADRTNPSHSRPYRFAAAQLNVGLQRQHMFGMLVDKG